MDGRVFALRTRAVRRSFIREILKVTEEPEIISFAGGLPQPDFFPSEEFALAAAKVLRAHGRQVLQYSTTEGYPPLREWVAKRYRARQGIEVDPSEILITNGSQQALDLVGKVFVDKGDLVLIERPGYLGAIQAFSMFEPEFRAVPLLADGIDLAALRQAARLPRAKLFYAVPNFGNPSGITYAKEKRAGVAEVLKGSGVVTVEDDPYGELRFIGTELPPIRSFLGGESVLLGSFSKIVAPGIRLGWVCAQADVMEHLVTAKQGTDLHSGYLSQRILFQYLSDNDLDAHIGRIRAAYRAQRDKMVEMLRAHFPPEVSFTEPEGGMFLWLTFPPEVDATELFEAGIREKVAFVPGASFYVDGGGGNTARLNFSNSDLDRIETGMERLARAVRRILDRRSGA